MSCHAKYIVKKVKWIIPLLFVCALLLKVSRVQGQTVNDVALRGLRSVHQNTIINPSWLPDTNLMGEYRASSGGHFGADLRSNFIVINDLFNSLNHNNDIQIFKLMSPPKSYFNYTGITATAGTGFTTFHPVSRSGNLHLNFGVQLKSQMAINLDGTEASVFDRGTVLKLNQNILRGMSWLDFSFGIAGSFRAFDYGIRVKYLAGLAFVNAFADVNARLFGDSGYVKVNSAYVSFGLVGSNPAAPISPVGHGIAVDLGLSLKISRKTMLDVSLIDLGFIGWDQYRPTRMVRNKEGSVSPVVEPVYTGENIAKRYVEKNQLFKQIAGWVKDTVAPSSIIPLYHQLGVGIKHSLNSYWNIGAIYHHLAAPAAFKYAVSVYGSFRFFRNFEVTLNTGLREGVINALGMGFSYTSRKFQMFITTENILAFPFTYSSRNFHILFGFNFRLGSKSMALVSTVDRVLCPDPIIDELVDRTKMLKLRYAIGESYNAAFEGKDYSRRRNPAFMNFGENNTNRPYGSSYSEAIGTSGKKGQAYDEVEFIKEQLATKELPKYSPDIPEKQSHTPQINDAGRVGKSYNEKYEIKLSKPKPQENVKKVKPKPDKAQREYGEKGKPNNHVKMSNKQRGLDFGGKGSKRRKKVKGNNRNLY